MSTILLIDDDEDVRDSVAKVLTLAGYELKTAASAEEGFAILRSDAVDVVIVDIIMPGINGVDAIKMIRELRPNVQILAISGGGNIGPDQYQPDAITTTAYLQAAADAGADSTLTKPFQRSELLAKVRGLAEN